MVLGKPWATRDWCVPWKFTSGVENLVFQALLTDSESDTVSQSELLYDWRLTASNFVLAPNPLWLKIRDFFVQLNPCGHNPYVTSSLTKSKSKSLYDWQFTANQFVLASSLLSPTTRIFFLLNPCGNSSYVTSSLTRRWVCL
jgi:hypothetical protein